MCLSKEEDKNATDSEINSVPTIRVKASGMPNPARVEGRRKEGSSRSPTLYPGPLLPASCGQPGEPQVCSHQ